MKVKHTIDMEDYLQQLVEAEESLSKQKERSLLFLPAAEELGLTKKEYSALLNKFGFCGDEYGEFFGEPK